MQAGRQAMSALGQTGFDPLMADAGKPLAAPVAWQLEPTRKGAPAMHGLGLVLNAMSALMLGAWLASMAHEALVWGVEPSLLTGSALAALLCCLARVVPGAANMQARLTLRWAGPVRKASQRDKVRPPQPAGWRVQQWGDAVVRVQVVLDAQRWLLLSVEPIERATAGPASRKIWVWLDAARVDALAAASSLGNMHRLRSLLALPPSMQADVRIARALESDAGAKVAPLVASWPDRFKSGFQLRCIVSRVLRRRPARSLAQEADSAFPPTQILPADHAPERRRA